MDTALYTSFNGCCTNDTRSVERRWLIGQPAIERGRKTTTGWLASLSAPQPYVDTNERIRSGEGIRRCDAVAAAAATRGDENNGNGEGRGVG
jgi:hypothetical protein